MTCEDAVPANRLFISRCFCLVLSPGPHMRRWLGEALPGQASFVSFLWAPKRIRRHQDVFPCRSWARRCSTARCSVSPPRPLPCLQLGSVGTAQAGAHKGCCVQAGTPRALAGPIAVSWEIIPSIEPEPAAGACSKLRRFPGGLWLCH